jgi:O-antigen/teichoic acid export membrane protein
MWNLFGGIWGGVLIVAATPWYVSRLGLEGYGILSFWLMMQMLMGLLDMGMGAALVREFANTLKDQGPTEYKRNLLKTLEAVYIAISIIVTFILLLTSGWIGKQWFGYHELSNVTISNAIRLMSVALGFQFPCGLYNNGLMGLQEQGKMNTIQIIGNSLRYGFGVAVLFWRADIVWFFITQMFVAVIQTLATRKVLWTIITESINPSARFHIKMIIPLWRFSSGMAVTSISAIFLSNIDRIFLSKMLPTAELGKYAVAFTATGILQMGIQPFYRAFFPRYSELVWADDKKRIRHEYFQSCKLLAMFIIPTGIIGWVFAPHFFNIWLGSYTQTSVDVFRWLLIGVTCSGLMWLPAAFQQAHGWTRLHACMTVGALIAGAPIMFFAIKLYGAVGATTVWIIHGVSDITLGIWLMHRRLLIGELFKWYRSVILPPLLISIPLVLISWRTMPEGMNKWVNIFWIGITGIIVIVVPLFLLGKKLPNNLLDLK